MSYVAHSLMWIYLLAVDTDGGRYSEGVSSPHRHVKTRLYFTSESHIHSLLTVLRYGGLCNVSDLVILAHTQTPV